MLFLPARKLQKKTSGKGKTEWEILQTARKIRFVPNASELMHVIRQQINSVERTTCHYYHLKGEIIIVIDTREQKNEYIKNRLDSIGIPCEITTLPETTGCDYYIANTHGSCGIQRKDSTKELILQMEDLRYDILPRLCNFTDNPVLLVEESHVIGEMGYLFRKENLLWLETGMHSSSYYGFLETVRQMGIDVVCTRDLNQSIWYLAALHGYLGKYHYPRHKKTFRISQQAIGMLACVPGIAEKRAREVLGKHSIREVCTMKQVEGLTEKQREKIRRVLEWKE